LQGIYATFDHFACYWPQKQQALGIQNTKLNINTYLDVEVKKIMQQVWRTL
jgi:hypothetical protein